MTSVPSSSAPANSSSSSTIPPPDPKSNPNFNHPHPPPPPPLQPKSSNFSSGTFAPALFPAPKQLSRAQTENIPPSSLGQFSWSQLSTFGESQVQSQAQSQAQAQSQCQNPHPSQSHEPLRFSFANPPAQFPWASRPNPLSLPAWNFPQVGNGSGNWNPDGNGNQNAASFGNPSSSYMQQQRPSFGFSQWSNGTSPYAAASNIFAPQPVGQIFPLGQPPLWMAQAPLPPSAGGTLLGSGSGSGRHSLSGLPTVTTAAPARSVPSAPSVPAAPAPVVRAEGTRKSIKEEPEEGEIVEPSKIQTPVVPYRAETHAVISYRPSPPPESYPYLGSMKIQNISNDDVLFYFGVLATRALLLPRFQFNGSKKGDKWGVKLTMYGHTIVKGIQYKSHKLAKVTICREALEKLKAEYADFTFPGHPQDKTPSSLDWVELLHDYCVQSGFPAPTYKRIDQRDGYSHEIVLQSRSYRGFLNSYLNESDSMNACAHRGMYMSLVNGNGFTDGDSGPSGLSRADPSMLALVPRKLGKSDSCAIVSKPGVKREADDSDTAMPDCDGQRKRRRGRGGRGGRGATAEPPKAQVQKKPVVYSSKGGATAEPPKTQNPPKMLNANFLPLANSRLPSVATPKQKEEKRWAFSAREINSQLQRLMSHNARLEKTCHLLSLERPEIRVEVINGEYTAAAYFRQDPFLTRAGAIGQVRNIKNAQTARESCAARVIQYILDMVNEDTILEKETAQKGGQIKQWKRDVQQAYAKHGFQGPDDGPDGGVDGDVDVDMDGQVSSFVIV